MKTVLVAVALALGLITAPAFAQDAWRYETTTDEMRDTATWHATNLSQNSVALGFPYGPTRLAIVVYKQTDSITAGTRLISISETAEGGPQFLVFPGRLGGHTPIGVRFDDGPVLSLRGSFSSDNTTMILEEDAVFDTPLLSARRAIVEVSFFNEGTHQFLFDLSGLTLPEGVSFTTTLSREQISCWNYFMSKRRDGVERATLITGAGLARRCEAAGPPPGFSAQ